jgi:hypothetical protein
MNKVKSKTWQWKMNRGIVKDFLPQQPVRIEPQFWWKVELFPVNQQEFLKIYGVN